MTMDIIYLNEIECGCSIGVWEWEKRIQQTVVISVEIAVDFSEAVAQDDMAKTVNYQQLTQELRALANDKHYNLLETLAYTLADWIEKQYSVQWLCLRCDKGAAVAGVKQVGVVVERGAVK